MEIGSGTLMAQALVTWPHQVSIGRQCIIEQGVYFKFDGIWCAGPRIVIGDRCFIGANCEFNIRLGFRLGDDSSIASGCKFIDHDHGIGGKRIDASSGREEPIEIGFNVWLGVNVIVLRGASIGEGSVVAAGGVVTRQIPPYEVWAGVPARKLRNCN